MKKSKLCSLRSNVVAGVLPTALFMSVTNATNNVDFVIAGAQGVITRSVPLTLVGPAVVDAAASIAWDSNGKVTGLDIKPGHGVSGRAVLEAVRKILETSEHPPKTTTIVP